MCLHIEAPGTLDGGDVLRVGRRVFVGQSSRSNADGIRQLGAAAAPYDYEVVPVPVRKSATFAGLSTPNVRRLNAMKSTPTLV